MKTSATGRKSTVPERVIWLFWNPFPTDPWGGWLRLSHEVNRDHVKNSHTARIPGRALLLLLPWPPTMPHQGEEWKLSWSMTGLDSLLLMKRASQAGWAPKTWQHLGSCHSEAEQGGWKQRRGKPAPPPPSWKAQFNFWVSAPNFPTGLV